MLKFKYSSLIAPFTIALLNFSTLGISEELNHLQKTLSQDTINPYIRNPNVSEELWNTLLPYFLPADSPERAALDAIFSKRRVLRSAKAMRKSDFLIVSPTNKIIVARHHKLRGYLIKTYLDKQNIEEWYWWKKRIDGRNLIEQAIIDNGYQAFMKTPGKWIYPLPATPSAKPGHSGRNFILVVEDVRPLSQLKNRKAYKKQMTAEKLIALFKLITENLLIDSVYADNTPFCKDGKIAFLDTEHAQDQTRPVPIYIVGNLLNEPMLKLWEQLIVNGLPR